MKELYTVILAAGKSTRFKGSKSKIFQELAGLPIIVHVYNLAKKTSGKNVIIVCNKNNFKELKLLIPNCNFVIQKNQKGTADAILTAKKFLLNKNFLILFGDVPLISIRSINKLKNNFKKNSTSGSIIAFKTSEPYGYGRIIGKKDKVLKIVEEINTNKEQKKIQLCNSGVLLTNSKLFFQNIKKIKLNKIKKEKYIPDIFEIYFNQNNPFSYIICEEEEMLGINTMKDFYKIDDLYQKTLIDKLINKGVHFVNPKSTRICVDTKIDFGTIIEPNVIIKEKVSIGKKTIIKSNSYLEGVTIKENCVVGPIARIRPSSFISSNSKIGNYVEIKNSYIGKFTSIAHLSYIGDCSIGKNVNIGAGTITCNYDGHQKHKTIIKDGAFIGSNTSLVAPVIINKNAKIGAGSVINKDIPAENLAIERSKLKIIKKN